VISDKLLSTSPRILVSGSAMARRRTSMPIVELIKLVVPMYRKLLNFDENTTFRVAAIRKANRYGQYFSSSKTVEVDCRLPVRLAMVTLAHELVHAEQYHEGRLIAKRISGRWAQYWNNEYVFVGKSYKAYRALPWEEEAFDREHDLAETALGHLGLTLDDLHLSSDSVLI